MGRAVSLGFLSRDEIIGRNVRKARDLVSNVNVIFNLFVDRDAPVTQIDCNLSKHPSLSCAGR
jgi:hypothetical protein